MIVALVRNCTVIGLMLALIGPSPLAGEKAPAPPSGKQLPASTPTAITPELQHEPHTCGYHALSAVYRAYGLDSDEFQLRSRLGIDVPAIPGKDDSVGTLHPDLFRVLDQDGFRAQRVEIEHSSGAQRLSRHLEGAHPAVVLIKRHESGGLHWIVLQGYEHGTTVVVDSLRVGRRDERLVEFLETEQVRTVLLIEPADGEAATGTASSQLESVLALFLVAGTAGMVLLWLALLVVAAVAGGVLMLAFRLLRRRRDTNGMNDTDRSTTLVITVVMLILTGCASTDNADHTGSPEDRDRYPNRVSVR